jgi:hypothetical protein
LSRRFLTPPRLPSGTSLPSAGSAGDLFFKSDEAKIYVHDGTNWVIAQGSGGGAGVTVSETAPVSPSEGDVWFSTSEGVIYVYYDSFWVDPTTGGAAGVPTGGLEGQILAKLSDDDYDTTWIDNYADNLRIIVKNDSGTNIAKGKVVMAVGAVGDRIQVALANADGSVSARFVMGVAFEAIDNGEEGYISIFGNISNLNTSAYTVGTVLYADPDVLGGLTATEPESPALDLSVAIVTRSHASTGRLFVRMWSQGVALNEVSDVLITDVADGEILVYEASSGLWVNGPAPVTSTIDGGDPSSIYTGDAIDGGDASSF